jgi:hypothetical protein
MTGGEHSDHLGFMLTCAASHEHCTQKEILLQLREMAMAGVSLQTFEYWTPHPTATLI